MKKIFLPSLLFSICFAFTTVLSADFWLKTSYPDNLIPVNNCITANGIAYFVGTDGAGIYYTDINSKSWNRILPNIDNMPIYMFCATKNNFFSASDIYIFRGDNNSKTAYIIDYFANNKEVINCMTSSANTLFVGTNTGLYKSDDSGDNWTKLNDKKQGDMNVVSVSISPSGDIYCAVDNMQVIEVLKTTDGSFWISLNDNLDKVDNKAPIYAGQNGVYLGAGNYLCYFDYNGKSWIKLSPDLGGFIKKILTDNYSNIFLLTTNGIIYFDPNLKQWIIGKSLLILYETLKDLTINSSNYLLALTEHNVYISSMTIEDFLKPPDTYLTGDLRLIDHNNNPLGNKAFGLYKNDIRIGDFTTGNDGKVNIASFNFMENDIVKVECTPARNTSNKPGKELFLNISFDVNLDNAKMTNEGLISFDTLKKVNVQDIKVNHTTIMPNLIFGIEWDAKREFLDTVASFLRRMSDYLYDVTDGQLCLGKVAIYDAGVNFNTCDVRIYAANNVWPHATVGGVFFRDRYAHMPRMFYANRHDQDSSASDYWYKFDCGNMLTTTAHELGHYFFAFWDEYVFEPPEKGNVIPSVYNYGFMKNQYGGEIIPSGSNYNSFASEMSNLERYTGYGGSDMYKWTAQWRRRGRDCWSQFELDFERTYNSIPCPIIKPIERGLSGSPSYVEGPMRNQPYGNVGQYLDVQIFDANNNSGDVNLRCTYPDHSAAAGTHCCIVTNNPDIFNNRLYQGLTASNGKMKVIGVKPGEKINVWNHTGQRSYFYETTVAAVSGYKNKNDIILEDKDIVLEQVAGDYSFVPYWKYNSNGDVDFSFLTEKIFNNSPHVIYPTSKGNFANKTFIYNAGSKIYSSILDDSLAENGFIEFTAYDEAGKYFAIPLFYSQFPFNENIRSYDGSLQLLIDSIYNTDIQNISILTSNLPTLTNGLEPDAERSGSIYSLTTFPNDFISNQPNIISINYHESDLKVMPAEWLRIFRWNTLSNLWVLVGGVVDSASKSVSVSISQSGTYGLFTLKQPNGIFETTQDSQFEFAAYPNPANANTVISFNLKESSYYTLKLYNSFGSEVLTLAENVFSGNNQKINFNTSNLSSGVYFLKLEVNGISEMKKLLIIK
ncbi:MAG: hypothetical protein HW421_3343 [Ignavibacteria bacterium]|nr:hypothetical protein [Ignavibacteria bacterium]